MTGFGEGVYQDGKRKARVEIRSLNHRFLDLSLRLPRRLQVLEERVRTRVAEAIQRGRIEIFVNLEEFSSENRTVTLDQALLQQYIAALQRAQRLLGDTEPISLSVLLSLPDWLRIEESEVDAEGAWQAIEPALRQALQQLLEMRSAEGARLQHDIVERMRRVAELLQNAAERAPKVVEAYRERLLQRIAEWEDAIRPDIERIESEIALFAERASIDEELVRARSHIEAFFETCGQEGSVGRKLDFLLQELQRELNTMGAKANDRALSGLVVAMKTELEKVREQVQNVE